ncbi:MAG TPA: right-handed parallel beta-helix repeat-containing protein [Thermoanaerobaculia bacterium]|nr:right-handed parallel beta-helix repeat-containing protein [Thermoanaerobaculia bacterium]
MFVVLALLVSAPAFAQATRTWVSGVGDDANPCSRTAPCKTFAGAISKTAAAGEINVIDPGGFGAVTITKSMTIDGQGPQSSILASGTSGVIINGAGIVVNLRNLSINGASTTAGSGVRILNAAAVNIDNCIIMNFTGTGTVGRGISIESSAANTRVTVSDSLLYNMGNAAIHSVPTAGNVFLNVNNTRIYRTNSSAIDVRNSTKATISNSDFSNNGNGAGVTLEQTTAEAMISNTILANNQFGVLAGVGGGTPTARLYACTITGNTSQGLSISAGASVLTHGNNAIRGNAGNETPTGASLGTQ